MSGALVGAKVKSQRLLMGFNFGVCVFFFGKLAPTEACCFALSDDKGEANKFYPTTDNDVH